MLSRIQSLGSCLIVLTLLLFAGSAGAQDVSARCEAAMDRAAGHYSKCLLSADASYARHENASRLANRQARCETRFDRRTSRAFSRYGADECTSTELVAALAERTVSCADGVSIEAGGETAASRLYVQDAAGGTLTETTLVLSGVDESTPWFTDRPYREAGQMTTAEFVALFSEEGANSFAEDPPNADFTCEVAGAVVNQAVTLTDPVLDEATGTLTYTAALVPSAGDGDSFSEITCDGDAHLFIDDDLMTTHSFICDGQASHACEAAGGTWDMGTMTCTPGVTAAGCDAGGGTWDAATSKCTPGGEAQASALWDAQMSYWSSHRSSSHSYNCFVGGYCSHAAEEWPPNIYGWDSYGYHGNTPSTPPAVDAGCNEGVGKALWDAGHAELRNCMARVALGSTPPGLCLGEARLATGGDGGGSLDDAVLMKEICKTH